MGGNIFGRKIIAGFICLSLLAVPVALLAADANRAAKGERGKIPDGWRARIQQDIAAREYQVSPAPCKAGENLLQAPNRRQNLRTWFTRDGILVQRRVRGGRSWTFKLRLAAAGVAGAMHKLDFARPQADGNRVTYRSKYLEQWFENRPEGLEQGFTIPKSLGPGELRLCLDVTGGLQPRLENAATLSLVDPSGSAVLEYGNLQVVDAAGHALNSHFTLSGSKLLVHIETAGALYPLTVDPLLISLAWQVVGDQDYALFGMSVAGAGDINGDGYDDVIVGATFYDNGQIDEGAAFIYLGSASGLAALPAVRLEGDQAYAWFGTVAGAGDVNSDGYDDVIVGAPGYDIGSIQKGAAFLFMGSAAGLSATPAWQAAGDRDNCYFGASIAAAGDVNGDGFGDVVVGESGAAFVYLGSAAGLSPAAVWEDHRGSPDDGFGSVAGAGDVNNDGYDDIIVGASDYSNGQEYEGAVFLYLGSATGPGASPAWQMESNQKSAGFGATLDGIGDVNHDGFDDIVVGAFTYTGSLKFQGAAFVYLGSASGLASTPVWQETGNYADAGYGGTVAGAGDVNHDGFDDLVVGVKAYRGAQTDRGAVYVYLGSASGPTPEPAWHAEFKQAHNGFGSIVDGAGDVDGDGFADIIVGDAGYNKKGAAYVYQGSKIALSLTPDGWLEGDQDSAMFGFSVAGVGDIDKDGYGDVLVGAPFFDSGQADSGAVFLYLGAASVLRQTAAWLWAPPSTSGQFGYSVALAGDINNDGYPDILVGAPRYSNGENDEGAVYVFLGTAQGVFLGGVSTLLEGNQAGAGFGTSVAPAGDVNGDGFDDIVIGAPGYTHGEANEGAVFVYAGAAAGINAVPWILESNQAGAALGTSVAAAGNVNGDAYADIIAGAPQYSDGENHEGAAFVWLGGAGGPVTSPLTLEMDQAGAGFGVCVAAAGDVNGDSFDDVIVGAPTFDHGEIDEGAAFVYAGGVSGLAAAPLWSLEYNQAGARFGSAVAGVGDTNLDGSSDFVVGMLKYSNGEPSEGAVAFYAGSKHDVPRFPVVVESNQSDSWFGSALAGAGDLDGDGRPEVAVGACFFDNGETDEGAVFVYDFGAHLTLYVSRDGLSNGHTPCFITIAEACSKALDGQEIHLKDDLYAEALNLDRQVRIILSGGWRPEFDSNSGGESVLDGSLAITKGSLQIDGRIVIE